jgi:hypothetical protein
MTCCFQILLCCLVDSHEGSDNCLCNTDLCDVVLVMALPGQGQ